MTRLAETSNYVNSAPAQLRTGESSKRQHIRELLSSGLGNSQIAALAGVRDAYVRAVRSLERRKRLGLPQSPSKQPGVRRRKRRREASGQPREELHELAQTLYRWRIEGRYAS